MYYLTSHVDFTDYVQNDAVELENKEKVTIVLNPKVYQKHNMFYTNSTIKFDDSPLKMFAKP